VKGRLLTAVPLAVVTMFVAPAASAAPPQPPRDSVMGSGAGIDFPDAISLTVDASSGPGGENPSGTVNAARNGTPIFSGSVTALSVTGGTAIAEARDSSANSLLVLISDRPTGDQVLLACDAPGCFPPAFFDFGLTSGDFVVFDALPPPTSTEPCKNRGYAQFGFKNQGLCVAFVERGRKQ
jgi:hypothetical protein